MGVRTRLKKMVKKLFFTSNTNVAMGSESNMNYQTDKSKESSERGTTKTSRTEDQRSNTEQNKRKNKIQV